MAAYYSLSFSVPDDRGSAIREVTLRLRGRERQARYRTSFLSLRMEQALTSQAWGSLLFGWEDNPHRAPGGVAGRQTCRASLHGVDLLFSVPIGAMELVSDGRSLPGRFRLVMQLVGRQRRAARAEASGLRRPGARGDLAEGRKNSTSPCAASCT